MQAQKVDSHSTTTVATTTAADVVVCLVDHFGRQLMRTAFCVFRLLTKIQNINELLCLSYIMSVWI